MLITDAQVRFRTLKKNHRRFKEEIPEEGSEADNREAVNECDEQSQRVPREEENDCADALVNPRCPYVTQINLHTQDLHSIKTALLGDDGTGMSGGIVFEIGCLKQSNKVNTSWSSNIKPIIYSAVSALIAAAITYLITH